MQRIIDSHCHIYPDAIAQKAVNSIDAFYDGLPCEHYNGTCQNLIDAGSAVGVSHYVVCSVATTFKQVSHINQFIARSVAQSGGAMTGLGALHPDSLDQAKDIEELISLGLKGIKMHPDTQKFNADDPRAMRIYEACEGRIPVCIHTGDYRYDYSNPNRVERVLKAFPKLQLVAPHLGGWSVWEEAMRVLSPYPNIIVDTSSSFYYMKPEMATEIIHAFGAERVLFGTDYPIWPHRPEIDYLLSLNLSPEEYEMIFWQNTANLYGIRFDAQ